MNSQLIVNIKDLLPIQKKVNEVVKERLGRTVQIDEYTLAFSVELFEYFNAIGKWKWWKQSHILNKEKVLDELADCFAFFLSIVEILEFMVGERESESFINGVEMDIQESINSLVNMSKNTSNEKTANDLMRFVGCNSDIIYPATQDIFVGEFETMIDVTIKRFSIAIHLATLLFEGITWEEITEAYRKKSQVNIDRQNGGY